jgi:hypothetical protein
MPIPAGVARFVLVGHLTGGETFETGFWETGDFATQAEVDSAASTFASGAVIGPLDNLRALITADCGYDEVRVYGYPTGGPAASFVGTASLGAAGTGTGQLPLQTCIVATLLTGAAGRRRRGRMYLPACGAQLSAHQLTTPSVTQVSSSVADLLSLGAPTPGHEAVVLSQVAGTHAPVTQVRVDSKPDIQRRRAESLAATSQFTTNL